MKNIIKNLLLSLILVITSQSVVSMQRPPRGRAQPQPAPAPAFSLGVQSVVTKKWELSNQSNQMAAAWVYLSHRCWLPYFLAPERDSGVMNPIEDVQTNFIYTSAGFFMLSKHQQTLRLSQEIPIGPGRATTRTIREMPWNEATDILIIVSPDGSVDFVKRNP